MASASAILPLSKISTQVFFFLLQNVPRHHCRVEVVRGCWACLLGMVTQRAPQSTGHALVSGAGLSARALRSWPRRAPSGGWAGSGFAIDHGPTLHLRRRVTQASRRSSMRLYPCTTIPASSTPALLFRGTQSSLRWVGNNLALDPTPWKPSLNNPGRRETWKAQILSAISSLF